MKCKQKNLQFSDACSSIAGSKPDLGDSWNTTLLKREAAGMYAAVNWWPTPVKLFNYMLMCNSNSDQILLKACRVQLFLSECLSTCWRNAIKYRNVHWFAAGRSAIACRDSSSDWAHARHLRCIDRGITASGIAFRNRRMVSATVCTLVSANQKRKWK